MALSNLQIETFDATVRLADTNKNPDATMDLILALSSLVDRIEVKGGDADLLETASGNTQKPEPSSRITRYLEDGADPNAVIFDVGTPMNVAVYRRRVDLVRTLLSWGAHPEGTNALSRSVAGHMSRRRGFRPIKKAIKIGNDDAVIALLDGGANPNALDTKEKPPILHYATAAQPKSTQRNIIPLAKLIEKGADVNARDSQNRRTPLHEVYRAQIPEAIARNAWMLLKAGADPSLRDSAGDAPLDQLNQIDRPSPEIKDVMEYMARIIEQTEIDKSTDPVRTSATDRPRAGSSVF